MNKQVINLLKTTIYGRYEVGTRFLIVRYYDRRVDSDFKFEGEMATLIEKPSVINSPFRILSLSTQFGKIRVGHSNRLVEVDLMAIPEDILRMFYSEEDVFTHILSGTFKDEAEKLEKIIRRGMGWYDV